jgi:tetratricopeptide (TPR) repeat protein/DNA-binding winged helix-turn-helix (wHTH) protein/TolB-like protein
MNGAKAQYTKHFYEFGPFRLDASDHQLLREGVPLPLTPKALDTLLILVQNSGRTLEKDELMNAVWPDTIVEENNLTQNVSSLRRVLGRDFPFIQTMPRRGYRFVAEVRERWEEVPALILREHTRSSVIIEEEQETELADQAVRSPAVAATRVPLAQRIMDLCKRPAALTVVVMALLLAVIGVSLPSVRQYMFGRLPERTGGRGGVPPLTQGKYLAVLPFRVVGDQDSLNYVAEGLREAISAKLFQLRDVRVVSAATVHEVGRTRSPEALVKDLSVNLVVVGSVQEAGEKLRVVVGLDDVAADRQVWTREFAGSRKDLLGLEDEIFASLVTTLWLRPNGQNVAPSSGNPTGNVEAYDLYLRGRQALRNFEDVKDLEMALRLFQKALDVDPGFAQAYAGLADASLEMYGQSRQNFWADKAIHAAQQALRLDPTTADAHFALGSVYYTTGDADQAVVELQRGLQLAPNSDEGYRRLGSAYLAQGRKDEALQAYEKAIQWSPYYADNYQMLGDAYVSFGESDRARATFQQLTDLAPGDAVGYEDIGSVYLRQGRWSQCIPLFQKALAIRPHDLAYSNLGTAYFYLKRYGDAVRMFEKAVELNPNEELWLGNLADAYRWSGNMDKALRVYDQAIKLAYKELQVNPRDASALGSLALYHAKKGDASRALQFIRQGRSIDPIDTELIYIEAVVQNLAGHQQEAFKALGEALKRGYAPQEAKDDPELTNLQGLPEFARLVQE